MTNAACILLYAPLATIALILFGTALAVPQRGRAEKWLIACFSLTVVVWHLSIAVYHFVPYALALQYALAIDQAAFTWAAYWLFLLVIRFHRFASTFRRRLAHALCAVPIITSVLALTAPLHTLFFSGFAVMSFAPLARVKCAWGMWAYASYAYGMLLAAAAAVTAAVRFSRLPRAHRGGTPYLFTGLSLFICLAGHEVYSKSSVPDFSLLGAGLCGIFLFLAIQADGQMDCLRIERREVFHCLDVGVLILDEAEHIIDASQVAHKLLRLNEPRYASERLPDALNRLSSAWMIARKPHAGDPGEDIFFLDPPFPMVYEMRRQLILDEGAHVCGRYAVLSNVTNNRLYLERLRETAGVDTLTGLPNRYRYQELSRLLDVESNLPISIILGDVNGLKKINDAQGHSEGDQLLRTAAGVLRRCCPPTGHAARIGGDEFALLLPKCAHEEAQAVIRRIQEALAGVPEDTPRPSIALGSATKNAPWENIHVLAHEADMRMYGDKVGTMGGAQGA